VHAGGFQSAGITGSVIYESKECAGEGGRGEGGDVSGLSGGCRVAVGWLSVGAGANASCRRLTWNSIHACGFCVIPSGAIPQLVLWPLRLWSLSLWAPSGKDTPLTAPHRLQSDPLCRLDPWLRLSPALLLPLPGSDISHRPESVTEIALRFRSILFSYI
jgi:hypothetical protein